MHFYDFFVVRTSQLNLPFTFYPTINYRKGSYILHVSELSSQVESWHHVAAAWSLLLCTWRAVNTVIEAFLWLRLHYTHFQTFISLIALHLSSSPLCLIPSVAFAPILSLLSIYSPCPLFKMHFVTLFCPSFHPCLLCTSWESPQRSQIVSRLIKVALQLGHGSLLREQMLQICLGVLIWGDQVQANGGWRRGVIRSRDSSPCEEQLSSVKHDVTQTGLNIFLDYWGKVNLSLSARWTEGWWRSSPSPCQSQWVLSWTPPLAPHQMGHEPHGTSQHTL